MRKNCGAFLEIFSSIYASQVSSKLCLLCGGSLEEDAFTYGESNGEKIEENKEKDKEQIAWFEKNNKQLN